MPTAVLTVLAVLAVLAVSVEGRLPPGERVVVPLPTAMANMTDLSTSSGAPAAALLYGEFYGFYGNNCGAYRSTVSNKCRGGVAMECTDTSWVTSYAPWGCVDTLDQYCM